MAGHPQFFRRVMTHKGFNKEGNHMVTNKGPYDDQKELRCPTCESDRTTDTRECAACGLETDRLRCPECNEKTIPVLKCSECLTIYGGEI